MRSSFTLLFLLCMLTSLAQEQPGYEQLADQYFSSYRFSKAAPIYERLARHTKAKPVVYYRLGYSYESLQQYPEAIAAYTAYIQKFPGADSLWLNVGDMQKILGRYDSAKSSYSRYKGSRDLHNRIAGCDSALSWTDDSLVHLDNLAAVNSTYSDWGAFMEQGKLYYTSNFNRLAPATQKISPQNGEPYFRVYALDRPGSPPARINVDDLSSVIDVGRYHIGPAAYRGDSVYFTVSREGRLPFEKENGRKVGTRRLALYVSDGKTAVPFPYNDTDHWSTGHAAFSNDGRVIYFVSDRPGGLGGTDIWYCRRDASEGWQPPQNCGAAINTPDDELFPVMTDDDTLYFASSGHAGLGGLDIFKAAGAEDRWGAPQNLRRPFNSSYDDFYFVPLDPVSGYLASNRPGGKGSDDIYAFALIPPVIHAAPAPPPVVKRPEPGEVFVIPHLYYDFDKSYIRSPDATAVLDSLALVLSSHPGVRIELSSHTDSRGSDAYNQALSERRAAAAVEYLSRKGIDAARMVPRGYGESRLVNRCANGVKCSVAEHQANRRTEIRVLE